MTTGSYRPLSQDGILDLLEQAHHCRIGLLNGGVPYVIPVNFLWRFDEGRLFFLLRFPAQSKKISLLKENNRVALEFEAVCKNIIKTVLVSGEVISIGRISGFGCVSIEILTLEASGREYFDYEFEGETENE